jgi:hypothetical protein
LAEDLLPPLVSSTLLFCPFLPPWVVLLTMISRS